jgi:hypothetical protein
MSHITSLGRSLAARVPPIGRLRRQRDDLAAEADALRADVAALRADVAAFSDELRRLGGAPVGRVRMAFPAGHFYSPIPDLDDVTSRADRIFGGAEPAGVDLRPERQLARLDEFAGYYTELPYPEVGAADGLRYRYDNVFFGYGDAIAYYSMLRSIRPRRILEIGSGWSSALALDVVDRFLGGETSMIFIEPFTERLDSLLRPVDRRSCEVIAEPLWRVDVAIFDELDAGDILFIDSTHVSKVGSDVNQLFFDVIPRLRAGVHVHVHDVFYPFEYPREWVNDGRAWTEDYLLRAYLTHNDRARVTWFNSQLALFHFDQVSDRLPLWGRNTGGSLWFETR